MTVTTQKKWRAFLNLCDHNGHASLWINHTLLPIMATDLQKFQHPSLQDFSMACSQVYRGEKTDYENEHCSIEVATVTAISDGSKTPMPGATLGFHKDVLDAASKALMGSDNKALGKIGLEFRTISRKAPKG